MIYPTVISFALGILLQEVFGFGLTAGFFVLLLVAIVALVIWKENKFVAKRILIIGFALLLGLARMGVVNTEPDPALLELVGQKVVVEARVADEPDVRDTNTRYIASPEGNKSKILLVAERYPELEYGDKIKFTGRLDLPQNFTSENGTEFDYISFLSKDRVHFLVWYPEIEILEKGGRGLVSSLYAFKNIFVEKIAQVVPEPNSSLLAGLIFGVKQSLGSDLLEKFREVGLIHIVVLSGYNIMIIAYAVNLGASRIGSRNKGFFISAVVIALFAIMVGLGATVVRASIMALIAILARFLGRPADALRWLFIAGMAMLLWNPLSLVRDPSFQLSFMATLGLIIFSPFVYSFISKRLSFITEKLALREIVASTLAVQIFILPLLIRHSMLNF